ncbi:MAG: DNA repair protein RadC [Fimbriimonadaceae bacterium]|nr:DNA repair protein RadC [Fimbriimonadaceae bacterium]QYK59482.1 MAG: DNA repair protein RadC [Fimbriimonadaceae bacterium]
MSFDRSRFDASSLRSLSHWELLALASVREERDLQQAEAHFRGALGHWSLPQLKDIGPGDLHRVAGLEPFESLRVLAAVELGRRIGQASQGERRTTVSGVSDAVALFAHLADEGQEHFCAAFLDAKSQVLATQVVHIGTLTASVVGAREVFREALRHNAASLIVAHNHPSGDPTPSPEDGLVTERLKEAGTLLDVPLLDHIVIGHNGRFASFLDLGWL